MQLDFPPIGVAKEHSTEIFEMTTLTRAFLSKPFAGEDEREEQAGTPSAGHHQGERHEGGREDQGSDPGVEPDQHQALGCLPQKFYPGGHPAPILIAYFSYIFIYTVYILNLFEFL